MTSDDKVQHDLSAFEGQRVIVTEKMDGENTTLGLGLDDVPYSHARSLDSRSHASRDHLKAMWAQKGRDLRPGMRVCGENLYAVHSIEYGALPAYFLAFSLWDQHNQRLAWDNAVEWFELLGLPTVQVLYDGPYDEQAIRACYDEKRDAGTREGYVLTTAEGFHYDQFAQRTAKFVRAGHVQTDEHWMNSAIRRNQLA